LNNNQLIQQIRKGISVLENGGIIAFPTDTVYGLGASMLMPQAIERIFLVKERPRGMPLPLLAADISQITDITETISDTARQLINTFLPGALTLVLPKSGKVPDIVTAGNDTVAVRIPAHQVPLAIIRELGAPIVGTSANLSGMKSPLTADEVRAQLGNKVDMVIDGGKSPGEKESTIVDVTGETPVVIREGAIPVYKLRQVCAKIKLVTGG